ncbi:hypothetical protein EJB05_48003 [Eragrostis curvula]|uniref:Uncharacterized protein n=1 Tax=Eragrostis curvula TaxID=38414 RepID=A0A5J9T0T0_9POAL|nr:hypothetical protein EJB05_48003 [Eragrostis curvula]
MAAALVKGILQGLAGCPQTFISARKQRSANSVRIHPLQQRGGVFQSLAWSTDGDRGRDRGRRRLKAQVTGRLIGKYSQAKVGGW